LVGGLPNAAADYVYAASGATLYRYDAQNQTTKPIVDPNIALGDWIAASTTYLSWTSLGHLYQIKL